MVILLKSMEMINLTKTSIKSDVEVNLNNIIDVETWSSKDDDINEYLKSHDTFKFSYTDKNGIKKIMTICRQTPEQDKLCDLTVYNQKR